MDRTVRNGTNSPTDARRESGHNLSNDLEQGDGQRGMGVANHEEEFSIID